MIELVYISHATEEFGQAELLEILKVSRRNNQANDITGILLFDGNSMFLQTLEGPESGVLETYERIKQDTRHDQVYRLGIREVTERAFGEWQMGFKNLTEYDVSDIDGYSDFLHAEKHADWSDKQSRFAVQMLEFFKREYAGQQA